MQSPAHLSLLVSPNQTRHSKSADSEMQILHQVLGSLTQAICWKGRNAVFLGCNQAFAEAVGLHHPDEIVGKHDTEVQWLNATSDFLRQDDRRLMEQGRTDQRTLPVSLVSGEQIWLDIRKVPLQDSAGQVIGLVTTIVRQSEEQQQAALVMQQSEQQLREQAQRERLLNRLIRLIRNSLDFDTILSTTLLQVREAMQSDRCQFAWYQEDDSDEDHPIAQWEVVKEAHYPDLKALAGIYPVAATDCLSDPLLRLQPLLVPDVDQVQDPVWKRFLRSFGFRSILIIPMQTQSGRIGAIACSHSSEVRNWSEGEIELLKSVAGQLAIALNQADLYAQSRTQAQELGQALKDLQWTQAKMVQSEKMSSLGQLVAGVAHEINNPVTFIYGNLNYASTYIHELLHLIQLYQQHYPQLGGELKAEIDAIDLEFLMADLPKLLASMRLGAERIQEIVLSLRTFSRMDEAEVKAVNLHAGLESTLTILHNRLKFKVGETGVQVIKEYGELPLVECYPGQLNQVFMNILSNAIDALATRFQPQQDTSPALPQPALPQPEIRIRTEFLSSDRVTVRIADNGCGISEKQRQLLFDPFFTTKPVGQGTGLGLSISYQIVVDKHHGQLTCTSTVGQGSEFVIEIPLRQFRGS
jgi:two-component system, NtrC family, sensor kinase